MITYLILIIAVLLALLVYSYHRYTSVIRKTRRLIEVREAALDIANKVVNTGNSADLYQYILDSCLKLMPKAKYGSILMFNEEGLLVAKASVGFNSDEINNFKLRLEESFLYVATGGVLDRTVIINRLEEIVLKKNIVKSGDKGFAIRSEVSSPLYINNELVGMLCIDGDQSDIFSEEDIYILDYMSNQVSIVINNQKLYEEILFLSRYDCLTELLNRNSFDNEAAKLLCSDSTAAENTYFVLLDMDDFKTANDTFGHNYGDELLRNFSRLIRSHFGSSDILGRYGGDEFVAILRTDNKLLEESFESIRSELRLFEKVSGERRFTPDFSYGAASFEEGHCSLDALYRLADARMYLMKNSKIKNQSSKDNNLKKL